MVGSSGTQAIKQRGEGKERDSLQGRKIRAVGERRGKMCPMGKGKRDIRGYIKKQGDVE
jgi:hypothetical protein